VKTKHTIAMLLLAAILLWMPNAKTVAQPSRGPSTPAIRHGQQGFGEYCASCHSARSANSLAGPGLKGFYSTHRPKPPDSAVRAIIAKGKGKMPAFGNLSSVQIDELIAYLKTL
jgi:mono/diheme cytochrome c family protein